MPYLYCIFYTCHIYIVSFIHAIFILYFLYMLYLYCIYYTYNMNKKIGFCYLLNDYSVFTQYYAQNPKCLILFEMLKIAKDFNWSLDTFLI